MNKKYLILIAILICLLVIFGFFNKKTPVNNPSEELLTYTSDTYGISFKYSSDYEITEKDAETTERLHHSIILLPKGYIAPVGGEGPATISTEIYQNNLDKQTVENWVKNTNDSNFKLSNQILIPTEVGGQKAVTYEWDGLYRSRSTVFEHNENIISVSGSYLDPKDKIVSDYENLLKSIELRDRTSNTNSYQSLVENYLKENISKLSPEKEVLGGKFYITRVLLKDLTEGEVSYEDGHNAYTAVFNYEISPTSEVKITNFAIKK